MSGVFVRLQNDGANGALISTSRSIAIPLFARSMEPVGAFEAACVDPLESSGEVRLPLRSATAQLRTTELAYRYGVLFDSDLDDLPDLGDWFVLVMGHPYNALFLTRTQLERVALGSPDRAELANGEIMVGPVVASTPEFHGLPVAIPYLEKTFDPWTNDPGVFQAYPFNAYLSLLEVANKRSSRWGRQHEASFEIVLGVNEKGHFPSKAAIIRPAIGDRQETSREFVASVSFSDLVPAHRVVVHETLLHAIGVRAGEFLTVGSTTVRRTFAERVLLPYRHVLCRVVSAQATDVGYAVTRLDESAMDLLGISSGDEVLVRGLPSKDAHAWPNIRVRALVQRSEPADAGIDLTPVAGTTDPLPPLPLDLIRRDEINLRPGDVAVIRPSFRSLISTEINGVLLVVVLGLFGAAASDNLLLAAALATVAVVIAVIIATRKFR